MGSLLLLLLALLASAAEPVKTYRIEACPPKLACNAPIRAAFDAWDAVSIYDLQEIKTGEADIVVSFDAIDGPGGIVGKAKVGGPPVILDKEEAWSLDKASWPDAINLPCVVLHEIGHGLGVRHINDAGAAMNPMAALYTCELTQPDIDALWKVEHP